MYEHMYCTFRDVHLHDFSVVGFYLLACICHKKNLTPKQAMGSFVQAEIIIKCVCVCASVCVHASLLGDSGINRGPESTHEEARAQHPLGFQQMTHSLPLIRMHPAAPSTQVCRCLSFHRYPGRKNNNTDTKIN